MKNAEGQGIVLVMIWAVVAVALSILVEARGSQATGLMPFTGEVKTQLSTTNAVRAATIDALDQGSEKITEANWRHHPKIMAIRNMVQSIDAAVKKGSFRTSQRRFAYCDEGFESLRRMAVDSKGVVRRYEVQGSFDDIPLTWQHYYDEAGVLRFVFIFGGPVNSKKIENRIYLDETGRRIWENHRIEPEKVGLSAFLEQGVYSTGAAKAFADASPCRELRPRIRGRRS